jgi:uncharacterized protein
VTIQILVDADACPVKDEIYKVALRHDVAVKIVSNSAFRVLAHPLVERVVVGSALKSGATVLAPNGRPFTAGNIGPAIATRAIMADLRADGSALGGPAPFAKSDRSRFLAALDEALVRMKRALP